MMEYPMNLQFFAEEEIPSEEQIGENQQPGQVGEETQNSNEKMISFADAQRLIQSEADKRVTAALAKQKKEYDKKLSLSGLSEQERAAAEKDQKISELEEQLNELKTVRIRQEIIGELSTRGLDIAFADFIPISEDAEKVKASLDTFEGAFRKAVESAVKAQLSGKGIPLRGNTSAPTITREQFRRMSLVQQNELSIKDPETYKKLTE